MCDISEEITTGLICPYSFCRPANSFISIYINIPLIPLDNMQYEKVVLSGLLPLVSGCGIQYCYKTAKKHKICL
jgi:hypothetical protein